MMSTHGRAPAIQLAPHDARAEMALLDAMLRTSSIIGEVAAMVQPDHYYTHAHGLIHAAIVRMHGEGRPVDLVTVIAEIERTQLAAEIGGIEYVAMLHDSAPCAGHYREYARIIRDRADARRNTGSGPRDGETTIVRVITDYLQARYRPIFRRADRLWSEALGREITRSEACSAPTSDLIPALLAASDYPASTPHGPDRSRVPGVYRQWAPIAWQDLIRHVPDEADSPEIADAAGEQFRGAVAQLLAAIESLSYRRDGAERTEVQRRSLIDWCKLFARAGPWRSVRSLAIWCRLDGDGRVAIAIHQRLAGQVGRGHLLPYTHRRLVQLAEMYGVGSGRRTSSARILELTPEYIAEQLAQPGEEAQRDGMRDDDGDAADTRACACGHAASRAPSRIPSHAGVGDVCTPTGRVPTTDG
jgi:DnaB-like helicase N terminal domain